MNPLNFYKYLPFLLRKKFTEKFIIIESDDWGLERAISNDSINWMKMKFGEVNFSRWSLDSLETSEDLGELYNLLERYKNKFEHPPVITANFITHNVDYSKKNKLNFIPLSRGFNKESGDVRILYKKGIEDNYIFPQLHGYSHYNLSELNKYFFDAEGKDAFENGFLVARSTVKGNLSFLHGEFSKKNSDFTKINEAKEEFKNFFGFYSKSIIPPTFIFDSEFIKIFKTINVSMVQSSNRLRNSEQKRYSFPYFQKRKGIYWSVRNARLDPHPDYNFNHEQCIQSIDKAFENKSPAIIDFHRVNFAGRFVPAYRDRTMKELKRLLDNILRRWPEAKFIHTQKLNDILWQQETR
ncbi:MAG: hypothetical protein ABI840_02315 [bacterium]